MKGLRSQLNEKEENMKNSVEKFHETLIATNKLKDAKINSLNEETKVLKEKLQKEVSNGLSSHKEEREKYSKMLKAKE